METNPMLTGEPRQESLTELVRGIFQDARKLSSQELLAAKLEIKEEIDKTVKSAISVGAGSFVLALSVVFASLMLVFMLDAYTDLLLWQSFGIVALVYGIAGGALLWSGKRKASEIEPYPEDSVASVKEDVRYIRDRATSTRGYDDD
jgi:hypothetical protein